MSNDPYGTDLTLTATGDLNVLPGGQLGIITGPDNCVQALTLRLKTTPGELPLRPDFGSHLNDRMVGTKSDFETARGVAISELRGLAEDDHRFLGFEHLEVVPVTGTTPTGLAVQLRVDVVLAAGERLQVADLQAVVVTDIVDPSVDEQPDLSTDFDATVFFGADSAEQQLLTDLVEADEALQDYAISPSYPIDQE